MRGIQWIRVSAEDRLDVVIKEIRQGRARMRRRKEMIGWMRDLEREQWLDRGSADVEGADDRLEKEMECMVEANTRG